MFVVYGRFYAVIMFLLAYLYRLLVLGIFWNGFLVSYFWHYDPLIL